MPIMIGRAFEWDDDKATSNLAKHGVPFEYAARLFLDPQLVAFDASRAGDQETRRKAVGVIEGKLFVVVYTDRAETCRIISARRANAMEQRAYGPVRTRPE
jgi:uncharacterized DUF497 family protein